MAINSLFLSKAALNSWKKSTVHKAWLILHINEEAQM